MPIEVTKRRENHIRAPEVGTATCTTCGSDLRAERKDFFRSRHPGAVGISNCPVCDSTISESDFAWAPFDEVLEERAREAFYRSQSHLHNCQTTFWDDATEETREDWRRRVR